MAFLPRKQDDSPPGWHRTPIILGAHASLPGSMNRLSNHKFKIGQVVSYYPRAAPGRGVYQIAALMPRTSNDEPQYRIKSETEPNLRSAKESELTCQRH